MNENVTLIPARKRTGNRVSKEVDKPKLKVAAYCRVSTDSDEQAGSYEVQVEHYTDYISRNKEWELAGIYADDGISGTNTKKREGFNEMIDDCMEGKIDLVITKSISRFARNTLDCLKYVRQLRDKNIAIIFEKENINTLEASGELLLTIMASLAQQESQSLSQNVKLGLQFRYQNGQVQVNHNHFLGYTKDADGNLTTVVERTEIKRVDGPVCYKDEEGNWIAVEDNTPVSMNMWGFTPDYFDYSEAYFKEFLSDPKNMENLKAEFFIPLMVNKLINEKTATVEVLDTTSKWFGVTYAADRDDVVARIQKLIDEGVYPNKLF